MKEILEILLGRVGHIKYRYGVNFVDGGISNDSVLVLPKGARKVQAYLKAELFEENSAAFGEVIIPASVEEIEQDAFAEIRIKKLKFASGSKLKKIGGYAFRGAGLIGEIVFPDTLEYIGEYAFVENRRPKFSGNSSMTVVRLPRNCKYHLNSFDTDVLVQGGQVV